jgi:hypothetical protein
MSAEPLAGSKTVMIDMDAGPQPLDALMTTLGVNNHDLVAAGALGLTHKVVAKGRRGRKLTQRAQEKIVTALNATAEGRAYRREDCFTYRGR